MIKTIHSAQNPVFKSLKKLVLTKAKVAVDKKTVLEGVHLVQTYLQKETPLQCIVSENYSQDTELNDIFRHCQAKNVEVIVLRNHLFESLSAYKNQTGVILVIEIPLVNEPAVLESSAILIDRLQDPGNLGTIIRTAAAAGIRHIYCSNKTVSPWSQKVLRAAVGAHFHLAIYQNCNIAESIRNSKIPVLATSPTAKRTIYQLDLSTPTAWLIGQEGQGVDADLMKLCTEQVSIPHQPNIESLNVAAATAICLFEQLRQTEHAR